MAILSSRAVQGLLDEASAFLDASQGRALTTRLNAQDSTALEAEWELIVLSALYSEGVLIHEPALGGASRLDFSFEYGDSGIKVVGDVTAVSDDAVQHSSIDFLSHALIKRLDREGIRGQISIGVDCEAKGATIRPCLPLPQEFAKYVFGAEFRRFAAAIKAAPKGTHRVVIKNEKASLSVGFAPGHWHHTIRCSDIRSPRDLTKNILVSALDRKKDQIKRSGHASGDGYRCVVLCDGGCAALTMSKSWDTQSRYEIIPEFLRKTKSIDLVVCLSVRDATDDPRSRPQKLEFAVEVFERKAEGVGGFLETILERSLNRLSAPRSIVANAKRHIERRFGPFFIYDGTRGSSYGRLQFEVSSRAVFDYLSKRIDREKFERVINPQLLEVLKGGLDQGRMVAELELRADRDRDDDIVFIRLGDIDAAVSRFKFPDEAGGSLKE